MDNKEDRNKKIIAIVLSIAVLALGIYKLFFEKNIINEEKIDTETISIVRDNSRFYTVSSCVSKYINYLTLKDTNNLLILLSEDYKTKNSITSENIYSFVESIDGTKIFSARKMYEQRVSETIYKYYVYGYIEEERMDSISEKQDYYIIVLLDQTNMVYAIEPYDGSMFIGRWYNENTKRS